MVRPGVRWIARVGQWRRDWWLRSARRRGGGPVSVVLVDEGWAEIEPRVPLEHLQRAGDRWHADGLGRAE